MDMYDSYEIRNRNNTKNAEREIADSFRNRFLQILENYPIDYTRLVKILRFKFGVKELVEAPKISIYTYTAENEFVDFIRSTKDFFKLISAVEDVCNFLKYTKKFYNLINELFIHEGFPLQYEPDPDINKSGKICNINKHDVNDNKVEDSSKVSGKVKTLYPYSIIEVGYKQIVEKDLGDLSLNWPIINGCTFDCYRYKEYDVFLIKRDRPGRFSTYGGRDLSESVVGFDHIDQNNIEKVRNNIENYFNTEKFSYVLIIKHDSSNLNDELKLLLFKEKVDAGMIPMKIFLSHKGENKELVRDYKDTLQLLGFDVWLDEDAMSAGENLIRSIHQGIKDSCAIVFFITDEFKDERWIAKEVDYAEQKKTNDNSFAIITIVFSGEENVPETLKSYVYKKVKSPLEGLREILRGLPIEVGKVNYK